VILRWAAVALDAWLAAGRSMRSRGLLRAARVAWRALPGDAVGWIVMRGCGIDIPTRQVEGADRTVAVVEDPRLGRWLGLSLIPIAAQTLGRYVLSRGPISDEMLDHELEHVRQWSCLGPLYLPLYFGSSALAWLSGRRPYWDNVFEVSARRRAEHDMATAASPACLDRDCRVPARNGRPKRVGG
jgi:hypothetical protein